MGWGGIRRAGAACHPCGVEMIYKGLFGRQSWRDSSFILGALRRNSLQETESVVFLPGE